MNTRKIRTLSLALLLAMFFCSGQVNAFSEIADTVMKTLPMVPEPSISTFVPSEAAPGAGLAVNIMYPEKRNRYPEGAPVAVVVPGGDGPNGLAFSVHAPQQGFVEVRFAFPGGGKKGFMSGGINDNRGSESQMALKDVLLFAAGKISDTQGRKIFDIVPVNIARNNLGLIGWANGGNTALVTLGKYADALPFINWLALYEPPAGSMFYPPNLGSAKDITINKHYRQGSCATGSCMVDYRKLKYDPTVARDVAEHKKRGERAIPGVVFFDENNNGRWDESTEFALSYAMDVGLDKQIYPPDVVSAMTRIGIFTTWDEDLGPTPPSKDKKKNAMALREAAAKDEDSKEPKKPKQTREEWLAEAKQDMKDDPSTTQVKEGKVYRHKNNWPETIASLSESEAYFADRDGSLYVQQICDKLPNMLVTIFASKIDHMQRQPDHPHIALLYNAFMASKAHWLRLNPDAQYMYWLGNMNVANFTNNKPNTTIEADSILEALEPEGVLPDYVFVDACMAELADRVRSKNFGGPLDAVLFPYWNGLTPIPPPKEDPDKEKADKEKAEKEKAEKEKAQKPQK